MFYWIGRLFLIQKHLPILKASGRHSTGTIWCPNRYQLANDYRPVMDHSWTCIRRSSFCSPMTGQLEFIVIVAWVWQLINYYNLICQPFTARRPPNPFINHTGSVIRASGGDCPILWMLSIKLIRQKSSDDNWLVKTAQALTVQY